SYKAKKIIFHHYTGDIDLIKDISDAGYYISIGRIYNKKKLLKIPDELLILEIDVLPRRDPSRLSSVILNEMLEKYAEVKNITSEELEAITQRNVMKLISDDHQLIDMVKLME
ncbi:MAG: hypothetical protein FK733_16450, partial [Asgard group archaeon]|nr:hypothetical protein [Asgard group archaeon]